MADPKFGTFSFSTPVRLYYSHLVTPHAFERNGVPQGPAKFEARFIIPTSHPELADLKRLAVEVAATGNVTKEQLAACSTFKSGASIIAASAAKGKDTTKMSTYLTDTTVFVAKSSRRPRLYVPVAGVPVLTDEVAKIEQYFYTGALVMPVVYLNAYTGMGGGVNAYVNDILALPGGERISGNSAVPAAWAGKIPVSTDDSSF